MSGFSTDQIHDPSSLEAPLPTGRRLLRSRRLGTAFAAANLALTSLSVVPAAAAPAAAPTAASATAYTGQRTCAASVVVRPGDGWIVIARRTGVRLADLLRLNGATASTRLYAGRSVCVPAGTSGSTSGGGSASSQSTGTPATCTTSYTVRAGDSWFAIASRHRIAVSKLYAANGASASTPLYPGRTICLPSGSTGGNSGGSSGGGAAAAPAPAPAPAPARAYSRAEVEQIVREVWPDEHEEQALVIVRRESNFVPTARNWCCVGLFQIYWNVHRGWLGQIGVTSRDQLFDPRVNAQAALALFMRSGGWGPWT